MFIHIPNDTEFYGNSALLSSRAIYDLNYRVGFILSKDPDVLETLEELPLYSTYILDGDTFYARRGDDIMRLTYDVENLVWIASCPTRKEFFVNASLSATLLALRDQYRGTTEIRGTIWCPDLFEAIGNLDFGYSYMKVEQSLAYHDIQFSWKGNNTFVADTMYTEPINTIEIVGATGTDEVCSSITLLLHSEAINTRTISIDLPNGGSSHKLNWNTRQFMLSSRDAHILKSFIKFLTINKVNILENMSC